MKKFVVVMVNEDGVGTEDTQVLEDAINNPPTGYKFHSIALPARQNFGITWAIFKRCAKDIGS